MRQRGILLGIILLLGLAPLPARSAVPVDIRIAGHPAPARPVTAEIHVVGGPSGKEQNETLLAAEAPGVAKLHLAEPGVWYVQARAAGFWGETRVLVTPYAGEPVELRLWPSTTLRAELAAPARLSDVSVRFQPVVDDTGSANADVFPAGTTDCRLDGRKIECIIPSGPIDYSLRSPGYVPLYRWNQNHAAREVVNLGRVEFRKGSSLLGRVIFPDGAALKNGSRVRVTLEPEGAAAMRPAEEKRSRIAGATIFANPRGIFVFEGLKPGGYRLSASAPGLISERREVTILEDLQAELREPIALSPPRALEVTIEPITDPWRRPWTVELLQIDVQKGHSVPVTSSEATANGEWNRAGLIPGDYILNVRRQPQGVWHSQLIALAEDVHLDVNIPIVRLAGQLKLGGAPLAGSLWFGGEYGAISVPITTNREGIFKGILPAADGGIWAQVDVVAEHPTVRRSLTDVRVPEPNPDGISRLDIDLPSNRLFGEVTDEREATVSSATVFLSIPGQTGELLQTQVDDSGQFSFNGLAAATYSLRAIGVEGKSDAFDVGIGENSQEFVTLVLKRSGELRGVVSSRYGAVAGARVSLYPDDRSGFDLVEWAITDRDGRFSVAVPPRAQHVSVTVSAPGFAYQFFRTAIDVRGPVSIQLEQGGGRLLITMNGSDFPFVFHAGGFLSLKNLIGEAIAVMNGQTVTAENLQAGQYEVCVATPAEALAFAQSARPKERCTGGFLPPGGQLALDVPSRAGDEKKR